MHEKDFYVEFRTTRPATLTCPYCKHTSEYQLHWVVRQKKSQPPRGADERVRALFAKAQSYMVLADDWVSCQNPRCRRRFEISGIKTMAFLVAEGT